MGFRQSVPAGVYHSKMPASVRNRQRRILLLSSPPPNNAKTIYDHLKAFEGYSSHHVFSISTLSTVRQAILDRWFQKNFDVLVLHYSIYTPTYLNEEEKRAIGDFPGLKVMFIQDEHRNINAVHDGLRLMKIDVLFTCIPELEIEKVYPDNQLPNLRKINTLTGYVPTDLLKSQRPRAYQDRTIDVGYRSRKIPLWMGALAKEKWEIVTKFQAAASSYGLLTDLAYREEDRLYGGRWIHFLNSCKSVLGTESGASVFDFTGDIQRAAEVYERDHPEATYEEIRDQFFPGMDGLIRHNQISPRCFEAAALQTLMIQYEGEYSGILRPWRHYVPLRKDMANIAEAIELLRDPQRTKAITECAYEEVARNPALSYEAFIRQFDQVVNDEIAERGIQSKDSRSAVRGKAREFYRPHLFNNIWLYRGYLRNKAWIARVRIANTRHKVNAALHKLHPMRQLEALWRKLPLPVRHKVGPIARRIFRRRG